MEFLRKKQFNIWRKWVVGVILLTFTFSLIMPSQRVYAQTVLNLPVPGSIVPTTAGFAPAMIKGVNLYPDNPLKFDFIIDKGDTSFSDEDFKKESTKLIKYFLASLTVPEDQMWVNLSPYEKDRIVPQDFGKTEMGRDLLAQDYMLKQLTASLMNPEADLGGEFWKRVYAKAQDKYGTTDIPMNTFNKIWIVPEKAVVYEHEKGAFVVKSHLKVMLEEDYLALEANKNSTKHGLGDVKKEDLKVISGVQSQIIKDLLIPEIEKEVNEGKTFANLRQIYSSVILGSWYKQALKESLLGQVYINQKKTKGVEVDDKGINEKIYNQYVESFKKGVYNYIKEDYDPQTQEVIPRKYFSGGAIVDPREKLEVEKTPGDMAELAKNPQEVIVDLASLTADHPNAVTAQQSNDDFRYLVKIISGAYGLDPDSESVTSRARAVIAGQNNLSIDDEIVRNVLRIRELLREGNIDRSITMAYQTLSTIRFLQIYKMEQPIYDLLKQSILRKLGYDEETLKNKLIVFHGFDSLGAVEEKGGIRAHRGTFGYRGGDGFYTSTFPHAALAYGGMMFDVDAIVAGKEVRDRNDSAIALISIDGYNDSNIPRIYFFELSKKASEMSYARGETRSGKQILEDLITEQIGNAPLYKLATDTGGTILDGGRDEIVIRDPNLLKTSRIQLFSPKEILPEEVFEILKLPVPNSIVKKELPIIEDNFPVNKITLKRDSTIPALPENTALARSEADTAMLGLVSDLDIYQLLDSQRRQVVLTELVRDARDKGYFDLRPDDVRRMAFDLESSIFANEGIATARLDRLNIFDDDLRKMVDLLEKLAENNNMEIQGENYQVQFRKLKGKAASFQTKDGEKVSSFTYKDDERGLMIVFFQNYDGLIAEVLEHLVFPHNTKIKENQRHLLASLASAIERGVIDGSIVIPQSTLNRLDEFNVDAQGQKTLEAFRATYSGLLGSLENDIFPEHFDQPLNDIYRSYAVKVLNFLNLHTSKLLTKQVARTEMIDQVGSKYIDPNGRTLRLVAVNNANSPLQVPQVASDIVNEANLNTYLYTSERSELLNGGKDRYDRVLADIKQRSQQLYEKLSGIVSPEAITRGDFILQEIENIESLQPGEIIYGPLADGSISVGVVLREYDPLNDRDQVYVAYKRGGLEEKSFDGTLDRTIPKKSWKKVNSAHKQFVFIELDSTGRQNGIETEIYQENVLSNFHKTVENETIPSDFVRRFNRAKQENNTAEQGRLKQEALNRFYGAINLRNYNFIVAQQVLNELRLIENNLSSREKDKLVNLQIRLSYEKFRANLERVLFSIRLAISAGKLEEAKQKIESLRKTAAILAMLEASTQGLTLPELEKIMEQLRQHEARLKEVSLNNEYFVLGLEVGATKDEVKKAYRKIALATHPDRNPGDEQKERQFREATDAYNIIMDKINGDSAMLVEPKLKWIDAKIDEVINALRERGEKGNIRADDLNNIYGDQYHAEFGWEPNETNSWSIPMQLFRRMLNIRLEKGELKLAPIATLDGIGTFVLTDDAMLGKDSSKEQFGDYLDMLQNGRVAFSLRLTGQEAARQLNFNSDFAYWYDELLKKVKQELSRSGGVHIDQVMQMARELISGSKQPNSSPPLEIDQFKTMVSLAQSGKEIDRFVGQIEQSIKAKLRSGKLSSQEAGRLFHDLNDVLIPKGYYTHLSPLGLSDERAFVVYKIIRQDVKSTDQGPVTGYFVDQVTQYRDGLLRGNPGWSSYFTDYVIVFSESIRKDDQNKIQSVLDGQLPFQSSSRFSSLSSEGRMINRMARLSGALIQKGLTSITDREQRIKIQEEATFSHEAEHERRRRMLGVKEGDVVHAGKEEEFAILRSMEGQEPFHLVGDVIELAAGGNDFAWSILGRLTGQRNQQKIIESLETRTLAMSLSIFKTVVTRAYEDAVNDSAMLGMDADEAFTKGGIDLNPMIFNTEKIKHNGKGVIIPVLKGPMPDFSGVEGFVPNIINITPISNLPLLLGIADPNPSKEKPTDVSFNVSSLPMESREESVLVGK